MEYRVVEVKWSRDGDFVGAPPILRGQQQLTRILNEFSDDGWALVDIDHQVGDTLRFSIVTLGRPTGATKMHSEALSRQVKVAPKKQKTSETASTDGGFPLSNGLYLSRNEDSTTCLYFEGGRVWVCDWVDDPGSAKEWSAAATAKEIAETATWSDSESGEYSVAGGYIEFSQEAGGVIEFRGTIISPAQLNLEFDSEVSGIKTQGLYQFVEVESLG